jgi:hypothetical protein
MFCSSKIAKNQNKNYYIVFFVYNNKNSYFSCLFHFILIYIRNRFIYRQRFLIFSFVKKTIINNREKGKRQDEKHRIKWQEKIED